jgi:flagellar motor switch protein FliM
VSFQGNSFETDYGWLKRFSARLKEAPVTMSVCLGEKEISVEELMRFSSGDVIVLKQGTTQPLTATVEGVPKFIGSPGTTKGMKSFQIKDIILGRE